jgi:hypothetical protein
MIALPSKKMLNPYKSFKTKWGDKNISSKNEIFPSGEFEPNSCNKIICMIETKKITKGNK